MVGLSVQVGRFSYASKTVCQGPTYLKQNDKQNQIKLYSQAQ